MTFVITIMLGTGALLIVSGLDNTPILSTFAKILAGGAGLNLAAGNTLSYSPTDTGGSTITTLSYGPQVTAQVQTGQANFLQGFPITASEWPTGQFWHNVVASCVETAGAIAATFTGKYPALTTQSINADVTTLVNEKEAKPGGATNLGPETQLLAQQYGIQTQTYNLPNPQTQAIVKRAIDNNQPVIWGIGNGPALKDTLTGDVAAPGGHAITIEGYDAQGVYAAEPNRPEPGAIAHYSWDNLLSTEGASFAVVTG